MLFKSYVNEGHERFASNIHNDETKMPRLRDLRRSTDHKVIGGVCAGIAEWLEWKATTVRLLFVVGSFVPIIPGFVAYLILWVILPKKRHQ